jgi:aminoglycoside 6'-N-acetyltransferase
LLQSDVVVAEDDLVIRRMRNEDSEYNLVAGWRIVPHVRRWWDADLPPPTLDSAKEELQPDTVPGSPSTACIIELKAQPIGFFQFYRWASYADEAVEVGIPFDDLTYGLDIFIGDPDQIGRGIGTKVVTLMTDYLIDELNASAVSLTTAVDNHAAQRCYEKAGFKKIKKVLDTDTYRGERVRSWLMSYKSHS